MEFNTRLTIRENLLPDEWVQGLGGWGKISRECNEWLILQHQRVKS
jgi:hypothetical protein